MLRDERLELADKLRVAPQPEIRLDPTSRAVEAQLLEPADSGLSKRLVREVGERWPTPECERLAQVARRGLGRTVGERAPACFESRSNRSRSSWLRSTRMM